MEKKQEIAASAGEKAPEQHAIDVVPVEHDDGKGTIDTGADVEKERLVVVEEPQKKKSTRVAALDAFRGLTIVVHIISSSEVNKLLIP
jgi:heparan-alpha-glucosaminide N-acetyltransferase